MVPQLRIQVQGTASLLRKAERGVLVIEVSSTSTAKAEASSDVKTTSDGLTKTFRSFAPKTDDGISPHPSAGITVFALSAPITSISIPLDENGSEIKSAPREYTATTTAEVVFRDLDLLARLASELAAMENVTIVRTEWQLTDATLTEVCREARVKAIRDAVEKAEDYAAEVGREVAAVHIQERAANIGGGIINMAAGVRLKQTARSNPGFMQYSQSSAPAADGPPLEPSTISVSANVDVTFLSKDGEQVQVSGYLY
ncbi:hypothetical protein VP1G_08634 [Cytospora mali]|uniref:SIMPL domain-containing protein n=1 Tax=Cytospora mali TaxID=578113 RepID=A0A194VC33_CYTMA|nr:hypothetical protein VP1G_08634 [Valsa mali var. pyri (nom. inval.)]